MNNKAEHLERYLAICKQIYERMEREGSWPWSEGGNSSHSQDVVESKDSSDCV